MEGMKLNVLDIQNQLLLCNDLRVNTTENNSTERGKYISEPELTV